MQVDIKPKFVITHIENKPLSKQAAIITTLQTTAKDHTLALKEHSTEVNALYNKIIELESRERQG
jgi:hypothetical protein